MVAFKHSLEIWEDLGKGRRERIFQERDGERGGLERGVSCRWSRGWGGVVVGEGHWQTTAGLVIRRTDRRESCLSEGWCQLGSDMNA